MSEGTPVLELLTSETPNGWKVSILLEELDVPYNVTPITLSKQEQKADWYVKLNPNGRIPTLIDHDDGDFAIFESGAIMIWLAEKYGRFMPADAKGRSRVIQWLMWQMSGLGPMMGQATVFNRYFEPKLSAVIDRYVRESSRLFGVMDAHLADKAYLAGDYSIADMACFACVSGHDWACVPIDPHPNLKRWFAGIEARPAVQRGVLIPRPPEAAEFEDKTAAQGKAILS